MAKEFKEDPSDFHLYTADEYIELVIDFIERLNPSIVVRERVVSQSQRATDRTGLGFKEFRIYR